MRLFIIPVTIWLILLFGTNVFVAGEGAGGGGGVGMGGGTNNKNSISRVASYYIPPETTTTDTPPLAGGMGVALVITTTTTIETTTTTTSDVLISTVIAGRQVVQSTLAIETTTTTSIEPTFSADSINSEIISATDGTTTTSIFGTFDTDVQSTTDLVFDVISDGVLEETFIPELPTDIVPVLSISAPTTSIEISPTSTVNTARISGSLDKPISLPSFIIGVEDDGFSTNIDEPQITHYLDDWLSFETPTSKPDQLQALPTPTETETDREINQNLANANTPNTSKPNTTLTTTVIIGAVVGITGFILIGLLAAYNISLRAKQHQQKLQLQQQKTSIPNTGSNPLTPIQVMDGNGNVFMVINGGQSLGLLGSNANLLQAGSASSFALLGVNSPVLGLGSSSPASPVSPVDHSLQSRSRSNSPQVSRISEGSRK